MSYPFEKQPGGKRKSSSERSDSLTDWKRVYAMDDEDIAFDEDSPEIQPGDWENAIVRYNGKPATKEQIEEFKHKLLAYINRPRNKAVPVED